MVLPAQTIRQLGLVEPFIERTKVNGMSAGLSCAGYDIRIANNVTLARGEFALGSTIERFKMPNNVIGIVHDKSTWARRGLSVFNTVIEPGWEGYLTLELVSHYQYGRLAIREGSPIAQVVFHFLYAPTESPYRGKYNNQEAGPQPARFE